jgi:hypothetical protein
MKTIPMPMPIDDQLTRVTERAMRRDYEQFKRESGELLRKKREAKERLDIDSKQSAESAKQMSGK